MLEGCTVLGVEGVHQEMQVKGGNQIIVKIVEVPVNVPIEV